MSSQQVVLRLQLSDLRADAQQEQSPSRRHANWCQTRPRNAAIELLVNSVLPGWKSKSSIGTAMYWICL